MQSRRLLSVKHSWTLARVMALLCVLQLAWSGSMGLARAQSADGYTIAIAQWSRPAFPGAFQDADDLLGSDASDLVTIMVGRGVDQSVPMRPEFMDFCEAFAGGFYADSGLAGLEINLPVPMDETLAYWRQEPAGSTTLICSLYGNAVYMFVLISDDTNAETTQALLNGIARDTLRASYVPTQALPAYSVEGLVRAMGPDGERPMSTLPAGDALPAGFQLVDKDYVVVD